MATTLQEKMDAVIKVFCNHLQPDFSLPWQRSGEVESSSSAFVIEDTEGQRYLLTNAHSVEYHSQVLKASQNCCQLVWICGLHLHPVQTFLD